MRPENKAKYTTNIEDKLKSAQERLKQLEHARNTSESAMTSRYDTQRESFAQDADLQRSIIERMSAFKTFLEECDPCSSVTEGAEFTIEFLDGEEKIESALYCPIMVGLEGVQIITPNSPIGKSLRGLKDGDSFSYKVRDAAVKCMVRNIR